MAKNKELQKAIIIAGGQSVLCRLIGKPQSTVSSWLNRGTQIPPDCAQIIQNKLEGRVSREKLRPGFDFSLFANSI